MRLRLYIDETHIGDGVLAVGQDGAALFFENEGSSGDKLLAEMERARLEFVAANGIRLSGFSWTGKHDKRGVKVFRFVEWWMAYA